jgi:hypothetical protein
MKFATADRRYLKSRKAYSEKTGMRELWSVADHWPLYVGLANLGRALAVVDLLRSITNVPGHVAEFGSWRGANLMLMAKLLRLCDPHGPKQVHCFDSWEGLTTFAPQDGVQNSQAAYKGSLDELREMISLYELDDEIVIHEGLIQDTLAPLLQARADLSFSLVYCDTDLYEPTKLILDGVHTRLSDGGLFVFDQWNTEKWPGETVAVREFLDRHGHDYEQKAISGARHPTLALKKRLTK